MTTLDHLPAEMVGPAELTAALHDLRAGKPFATLLIEGASTRAAALEALLDQVTDDETRVMWVGNPLRSPLTLERLLLQAVGAELDLRVERSPADLTRMLTRPVEQEARLLLIVQQPETLALDAREALGRMAPYFAKGRPVLQILFCGSPAFRLPEVQQPAAVPATIPVAWRQEEQPPLPSHGGAAPLLLLLLLAAMGASVSQIIPPRPSPAQAPAPEAAAPQSTQTAEATDLTPTAAPPEDVAALRREFDTFLAQRPSTAASLTEPQKDALFQEFLARHRQQSVQLEP